MSDAPRHDRTEQAVANLSTSFDKHLLIYASNGKELSRLGDLVQDVQHSIAAMMANSDACSARVNEMFLVHMEKIAAAKVMSNWMKNTIMIAATLSAITVIFAAVKIIMGAEF